MWFHGQREHLKEWLEEYLALEREATCIKVFQPMSVPGLLQTEGYIRAGAGKVKDVEGLVMERLTRREVLEGEDPPILWVILDEAAIRRPVGGPEVMKAQLQHLLEMGDLPNITIQVVRELSGAYVGMYGGLIILTMPEHRDVGYAEAQFGGRLIEDKDQVVELRIRYDRIRAKALSDDDSHALIAQTMEAMK